MKMKRSLALKPDRYFFQIKLWRALVFRLSDSPKCAPLGPDGRLGSNRTVERKETSRESEA